ncbi:MAG: DUF6569 family protein [Candidatus Aminicenantes bacterium]
MGRTIENYLKEMGLGEAQGFENMAVFPLTWPHNGGPEYITLREALEKGVFSVTETSEGGSVPDLKVDNRGDVAVLLLDGEELAGAKQNRIINTTILVGPKSGIKIPVSCTEQGRWSYVSREFAESGHQMDRKLRSVNMRAVHASLVVSNEFRSDQGMVWNEVEKLSQEAAVPSVTGAMKDVYDAKGTDLDDYLKSFRVVDGQKGMLVFLDGRPVGFDFVSRPGAFGQLFSKLAKSYAMEAMLAAERRKRRERGKKARIAGQDAKTPSADEARSFLAAAAACDEQKNESVGLGSYYRYAGPGMVGSALAVDQAVVHMAFFGVDEGEQAGNIARMSSRRGFRI